jgi:glutathione peroxidase
MSFHEFTVKDIDGKDFKLSKYAGKPVLVVNVASECGFTPQYKDLQELHKSGVVVIGFPCNQFGKQEPGNEQEIKEFAKSKFGVTFPLMSKIDVIGANQSPVYRFLTEKGSQEPKWNFHKFLVDSTGKIVSSFSSKVNPLSPDLKGAFEKLKKA